MCAHKWFDIYRGNSVLQKNSPALNVLRVSLHVYPVRCEAHTASLNEICVSPTAQTPALLSALLSWSLCKLECVRVGNAANRRVYCKNEWHAFSWNLTFVYYQQA